jgi:7-keto-8-aminopelargonate synthetase-like enzyme
MTTHPATTHKTAATSNRHFADLDRLRRTNPMFDAVIEEIDGRRIRIGDQWLIDYASCNYLGFDLDPEIMGAVEPLVRKWGTHPSWSRLLGNPRPYIDIEDRLTELLGAEDTLALPTISHIHSTVLPVLVGQGTVLMDAQAHKTIYDGCSIARGRGATLLRFEANDPDALEKQLRTADPSLPRVVCMDGVNSMTGNTPDLPAFAQVCRDYGALLYVDDAHGFGVIGENPTEDQPYGLRGNSIVRHFDESYEDIVLVGGFSKAYSSLMAFLALPTHLKNLIKVAAPPYLYSGPSPTASLATVLAGLEVNDARGDVLRADLYRKTKVVLDTVEKLGMQTPNESGLPIIELPLGNADDIDAVGEFLFSRGIYVTLAAYPLVPRNQVGFRIQVTASNTDEEIDELCEALVDLHNKFEMRWAE